MRNTSTNRTLYAVISAITLSAVLSGCGAANHQRLEFTDPVERMAELKTYDTEKLCMGYTNPIVQPETEKDIATILRSRSKTVCSTVRGTRVVEVPTQFASSSAATGIYASPSTPSVQSEPAASQVAVVEPLTNTMAPGETEKRSIILGIVDDYFVRSGVLGGIPYRYSIWDNGHITGSVDGPLETYAREDPDRWVIIGKVDQMTDVRTWYIRNDGSNLMLFMDAPDRISAVCVMGADFPGRAYAVRIDKNRVARFQDGDCKTGYRGDLLAQIISGTTVLTEYYEWPYDYPKNAEGNAATFEHVQKLLAHLMQKYG